MPAPGRFGEKEEMRLSSLSKTPDIDSLFDLLVSGLFLFLIFTRRELCGSMLVLSKDNTMLQGLRGLFFL